MFGKEEDLNNQIESLKRKLVLMERHRDQWRAYAYTGTDRPKDRLDDREGEYVGKTLIEVLREHPDRMRMRDREWCLALIAHCDPKLISEVTGEIVSGRAREALEKFYDHKADPAGEEEPEPPKQPLFKQGDVVVERSSNLLATILNIDDQNYDYRIDYFVDGRPQPGDMAGPNGLVYEREIRRATPQELSEAHLRTYLTQGHGFVRVKPKEHA